MRNPGKGVGPFPTPVAIEKGASESLSTTVANLWLAETNCIFISIEAPQGASKLHDAQNNFVIVCYKKLNNYKLFG